MIDQPYVEELQQRLWQNYRDVSAKLQLDTVDVKDAALPIKLVLLMFELAKPEATSFVTPEAAFTAAGVASEFSIRYESVFSHANDDYTIQGVAQRKGIPMPPAARTLTKERIEEYLTCEAA